MRQHHRTPFAALVEVETGCCLLLELAIASPTRIIGGHQIIPASAKKALLQSKLARTFGEI